MSNLEMKLDAVLRLCTTEDKEEAAAIRSDLRRMMEEGGSWEGKRTAPGPEYEVRKLLMELGTPDHLIGHPYLVQAVLWAYEDRSYLDSLTNGLYPALAKKFDTTASRAERAIRHAIEVSWTRCDYDVLNKYFGNTVSPEKGKPTNGEFIARVANVLKLRLKKAV